MTTLHITNGDCAAETLRRVVSGPVEIAADVLHEGPCPPIEGNAWHEVRARFLSSDSGAQRYEEIRRGLARADETIADTLRRGGQIVMWFEHDLFDQLALIRVLDLMAQQKPANTRGSLICIGSFPGIDRFIGLGQLTADQLATLVGTGVPLIAGHFELARNSWRAFRSPDPAALVELTRQLDAARTPSEGARCFPSLPTPCFTAISTSDQRLSRTITSRYIRSRARRRRPATCSARHSRKRSGRSSATPRSSICSGAWRRRTSPLSPGHRIRQSDFPLAGCYNHEAARRS